MEQCSTAWSPQPLVTSLVGQWPPTPVLMVTDWWERRTGPVWWMEHGQELNHSVLSAKVCMTGYCVKTI